MESERQAYLLYCEDSELGDRLARALDGLAVRRVRSREALLAPSTNACAMVVGIDACSRDEIAWLRSTSAPLSPPCIVVAHLSVECLRRLHPLRSAWLRVVWADEAETRLVKILKGFATTNCGAMSRLGLKLLSDHSLRPPVREALSRVCGLRDDAADTPFIPENSVRRLAGHVDLAPPTLRQYWREDMPLRCGLKAFLTWAVILWAVRARSRKDWNTIARRVGLQRRTLQRNFVRLAGCTLREAAQDPQRVVGRFNEWVDSVWDPRSGNEPGTYDPAPARAPLGRMP